MLSLRAGAAPIYTAAAPDVAPEKSAAVSEMPRPCIHDSSAASITVPSMHGEYQACMGSIKTEVAPVLLAAAAFGSAVSEPTLGLGKAERGATRRPRNRGQGRPKDGQGRPKDASGTGGGGGGTIDGGTVDGSGGGRGRSGGGKGGRGRRKGGGKGGRGRGRPPSAAQQPG